MGMFSNALNKLSDWQQKNRQRAEIKSGRAPTSSPKGYEHVDDQIRNYGELQQATASRDDLLAQAQAGNTDAMKQVGAAVDRTSSAQKAVDEMKQDALQRYLDDRQEIQQSLSGRAANLFNHDNDYTLQDIINEVGDDPEAVKKWITSHPGYEVGPKTKAYLGLPDDAPSEINSTTDQSGNAAQSSNHNSVVPSDGNVGNDGDSSTSEAEAVANNVVEQVNEASTPTEQAEALSDQMKSKRAKDDIRSVTRNLWQSYEDGEFGPKGSPEAKSARNYFILNELMTASQNWSKVEQNYIENLSRAANGETIKATDTSSFAKSKFDQMRDNAMNRMEQGKDSMHNADVDSINEASDVETKQDIAQNLGPQGLAQAASTVQAEDGTFDPLTQAVASGDENQIQQVFDATLNDVQIKAKINELTKDSMALNNLFDEQSLQSRLDGLVAQNSMTQAEAQMLLQKLQALKSVQGGFDGLRNALKTGNTQGLLSTLGDAATSAVFLKLIGSL